MPPEKTPTYRQLVLSVADRLRDAGVPEPGLDARLLVRHASGLSAEKLLSALGDPVPDSLHERLNSLVERREKREPLQYITGHAAFYGREFDVDSRVLIPRPETEQLVEQALDFVKRHGLIEPRIADIATGSGAIAVTLALEIPWAEVWATDISEDALAVARLNAATPGADVRFARGDLFESLAGRFDVIVSNPPYIRSSALDRLEPELAWEPRGALNGGEDGMDIIRPLLASLGPFLKDSAALALVEFDPPVARESARLAKVAVPGARVDVLTDLAGLERVLVVERE
jgi:release factor glutamine methyltransferase